MAFQIANKNTVTSISTANTNLDGTGTISELFTGNATYGSILQTIRVQSVGAVPSGMIRIFIKDDQMGASWYLLKEITVPVSTTSTPPYPGFATTVMLNLSLQAGYKIGVSTQTGNTFNIIAFGYDITGFI